MANCTTEETALPMVKNAKSAEKTIISRQFVKVVVVVGTTVNQEERKGETRNFMK